MKLSPLRPSVEIELSVIAPFQDADRLSNALKDAVYEFAFFKAQIKRGDEIFSLIPLNIKVKE